MTLLLAVGLGGCDRQSPQPEQPKAQAKVGNAPATSGEAPGGSTPESSYRLDRSKAGTPAPDFAFGEPDGGDASLQDVAGRPMLVNLWATWCAPCVAEMPTLDAIAKEYGPKGLAVFTISQDTQGKSAAGPFFAKHALPHLKAWTDPDNNFGFHYATGLLPTTVIYDARGKEMLRVIGSLDWNGKEARALIDAAMAS
ncbi:TlpA disulfide reductase family protein [Sphingobium sp. AN558]|uniref:TlpA family protein disulfide reductase n=1 Tax=Sphingobium sp. AN558 TaxID=3133442 RepID=UPI0030BCBE41